MGVVPQNKLAMLEAKTRKVLNGVGYAVSHEGLSNLLFKRGLKQTSSGRFVFEDSLINEFVDFQKARGKSKNTKVAEHKKKRSVFKTGFGNMAPKYYDFSAGCSQSATLKHLIEALKFAHQEEKIGLIGLPFSVTDIPVKTAPIESFLITVKHTNKYGGCLDPFCAELVKYFVDLSDIFLGPNMQNSFIDHCNCINPVLRLEERTAAVMFERAKFGIDSLITSMPLAGGNAPVTLDGAIIEGTAEIVGGLIISYLLNSEVNLKGYISSGVLDMRSGNSSQSSPETVMIDCGVVQLMDHAFGGNTFIGGRTYVSARKPGLQATYEKMFKAMAYQKYCAGDIGYGGAGILENGAVFCLEQFTVDMDVQDAIFRLNDMKIEDDNVEGVIKEAAENGVDKLMISEHTLKNCKKAFWEPFLFLAGGNFSEKELLEKAHSRVTEKINSYRGYECDEGKVRKAEKILHMAKKEFLDSVYVKEPVA
jgi:trimethylamine--corrinoid protein Co-methyltransferase